MKSVRLVEPGQSLELFEVPIPEPGPMDVRVRVRAAGICRSDAHYRAGVSSVSPLPLTLGHEVAGVIDACGAAVSGLEPGDRVCLHYLATCGCCAHCRNGTEQFCASVQMMGKHRDGGYAEWVVMPAASAIPLPEELSFVHGAVMMCSSATSLHALNKSRLRPGESVAIFGVGGLGMSAIQLARSAGAGMVFAVDINPKKLALAEAFNAVAIDARSLDPVSELKRLTDGRGVDVALELIGLPGTMRQAVRSLGIQGRAVLVGITDKTFEIAPYQEILNKEAEIIGVSDHLASEIPLLLQWAREGKLDLLKVVTRNIPLEAKAINEVLDSLERFGDDIRSVIIP